MNYAGSCKCKSWTIEVSVSTSLGDLHPRVCDCDYCQSHPSAIISDPQMLIALQGDMKNMTVNSNGDQLANFYHCKQCDDFLAVGCNIDGALRGAVNAWLLDQKQSLGTPVQIQPRLLSASEKLSRWGKLWGQLKGV